MKIKQRKDDCHYETVIEIDVKALDFVIGYGFSQEEADTKALKALIEKIKAVRWEVKDK